MNTNLLKKGATLKAKGNFQNIRNELYLIKGNSYEITDHSNLAFCIVDATGHKTEFLKRGAEVYFEAPIFWIKINGTTEWKEAKIDEKGYAVHINDMVRYQPDSYVIWKPRLLIANLTIDNCITEGFSYTEVKPANDSSIVWIKLDNGEVAWANPLNFNFNLLSPSIEFKIEDKVYWNELEGYVRHLNEDNTNYPLTVLFSNGLEANFTIDGRTTLEGPPVLTFKPQQLDYSCPPWQPKEGEICLFWDVVDEPINCAIRRFKEMRDGKYLTTFSGFLWQYCAPCPVEALPAHFQNLKQKSESNG